MVQPVVITQSNTVSHTFTIPGREEYQVKLSVENPYDQVEVTGAVGPFEVLEEAEIVYDPQLNEINEAISFQALFTPTNVHTPTFTWDFGDGSALITGTDVSSYVHNYQAGNDYNVKLSIENIHGSIETSERISIKEALESVSFTLDPITPTQYATFTLNTATTRDTASQPVTYAWTFDNATQVVTQTPKLMYAFDTPGFHQIDLSASNGYGDPVTHSAQVYVDGIPLSAVVVTKTLLNIAKEREATFSVNYSPEQATAPVSFEWDFGDGASLTTQDTQVVHEYPANGSYNLVMTASNGYGDPIIYQELVEVPFDTDGDGLTNIFEVSVSGTNPDLADSDRDGLSDAREYYGYYYTHTLTITVYADHADFGALIKPDPNLADTDDDGLNDGDEWLLGGHPLDQDTDDDGLPDNFELEQADGYVTSPINQDSEGDGLNDASEVGDDFSNPMDTDGDHIPNALDLDDDNDGFLTSDEVADSLLPAVGDNDVDQDDLPNWYDTDSDGDQISDQTEGREDEDNDGIPNYLDVDSDDDGQPDLEEGEGDVDNDSTPNYLDQDSDGDGQSDLEEGNGDADGDGTPNYLDADDQDGPTADPDEDGLDNATEARLGTDADNADSDGDGLSDAEEAGDVNDPTNSDGDDLIDALDADDDNDGLSTADEQSLGTDHQAADSDGDGLSDAEEVGGVNNPTNSDGDDLIDALDADDDNDGLSTADEQSLGTDHQAADSDGDGLSDAEEIGDVNDPTNSDGDDLIDALDADDDNDGLSTADEQSLGTDHQAADSDGDGLSDAEEVGDVNNPTNSDGDDLIDALDADDDNDGLSTCR